MTAVVHVSRDEQHDQHILALVWHFMQKHAVCCVIPAETPIAVH